ncbi:MAG: ATP synthase F1 subunit epsilon [Bacteroidia bacterium]|jgi:F-type H+-transporting ATPase subunit epsilon|nr:ATP synthase F1 subunit epsilon [Bacteroidia bacterium]
MFLEIITPDKIIYEGEVKLVQVPGKKGAFEMLKNHAPIISSLGKGRIKVIEENGTQKFFDIEGGIVENKANKIVVLVESV